MSLEAALTAAQADALGASAAYAQALTVPADKARGHVFTALPEGKGAAPPYSVLGEDQWLDDGDDCQEAFEVFSTVHHWAKPAALEASPTQGRAMAAAARAALAVELVIAGGRCVAATCEETRFLTDPDGSTHVVQTFRYLVEPSA